MKMKLLSVFLGFCVLCITTNYALGKGATSYLLPNYMHSDIAKIEVDLALGNGPRDMGTVDAIPTLVKKGVTSATVASYYLTNGTTLDVKVYTFSDKAQIRSDFAAKANELRKASDSTNNSYFGRNTVYATADGFEFFVFYTGNVLVSITQLFGDDDLEAFGKSYADWLDVIVDESLTSN